MRSEIDASLIALHVPEDMIVVERGDVTRARLDPALFLRCRTPVHFGG